MLSADQTLRDAITKVIFDSLVLNCEDITIAEAIVALLAEHGWVDGTDLRERLTTAAVWRDEYVAAMEWGEGDLTTVRLHGMAEGVRLALSYLDEMIRSAA